MEKGIIIQATSQHRQTNCVHYVIFLEMNNDNKSFVGICISSKDTKPTDLIQNAKMSLEHFEPITTKNGYKVTYGNCKSNNGETYLCKCPFEKDLKWFIDHTTNQVQIVGRLTPKGIHFVEEQIKGMAPKSFGHPIWEINKHPELIANP